MFKKQRKEPQNLKPAALLKLIQEEVPVLYKNTDRFKESKEFLEYNEWGLALETLIEMADESGDFFSENFWLHLATCADKMQMTAQAGYCRQKVLTLKDH